MPVARMLAVSVLTVGWIVLFYKELLVSSFIWDWPPRWGYRPIAFTFF